MFSYFKYMLKNEDNFYLKINATIKAYEEALSFLLWKDLTQENTRYIQCAWNAEIILKGSIGTIYLYFCINMYKQTHTFGVW